MTMVCDVLVVGAMGKRTRFQQKELSQLMLRVERTTEALNQTGQLILSHHN